jgi:secreted protein with Ig-like and vWFA domain
MNADDPKFTAHVLGEDDDLTPAERAEVEALIANDPAAAAEAAETRALAARLRAELPGEAAGALQQEQRAAVLEAAKTGAVPTGRVVRFPRRAAFLAAIAACVIVGVSYALLFRAYESEQTPKSPVAQSDDGSNFATTATPPDQPAPPTPLSPEAELQQKINSSPLIATAQPSVQVPAPAQPVVEEKLAELKAMAVPPPAESAPQSSLDVLAIHPSDPNGVADTTKASAPQPSAKAASVARSAPRAYAMNPTTRLAGIGKKDAEADSLVDGTRDGFVFKGRLAPEDGRFNTTSFDAITENAFLNARENPLSTFSIDVDTASYAIVRRFLNENRLPPKGAVRVEELLNYFTYDYPQPKGDVPFSATMEVAACPWAPEHRLVRVGLKGREVPNDQRPPSNLVFLIDVSGSMNMPNKLPLLQKCFSLLVEQLGPKDRVAIVTYASGTRVVLEPTQDKEAMQAAIDGLRAGGSTYGSSGVELAYRMAERGFVKGGTNRVILATDGDWNVGITNQSELLDMIAQKARSGVFLTVLGFGMDNLKDSMLVKLADRGNGHYAYIDTALEAKKVFVEQLSGTLVTIAKDVKIQVEFNPAQVGAYRLIGYEKRLLAKEDFNDDQKDAGEIGAGHTVTALYEVVPAGKEQPDLAMVDKLKYQPLPEVLRDEESLKRRPEPTQNTAEAEALSAPAPKPTDPESPAALKLEATPAEAQAASKPLLVAPAPAPLPAATRHELLTLKLRYKAPDGDKSKLLEFPLTDGGTTWEKSSPDFRFAAAVAGYGMLLRDSTYRGEATWHSAAEWAREGLGRDKSGYRAEFLGLLEKAKALKQ